MRFYIIRHGLSEDNVRGVLQGHSDSPLSIEGHAQADLLGRYFAEREIIPVKIFTSPLKRAIETAEIIVSAFADPVTIEPVEGLKEIDVGNAAGLTFSELLLNNRDNWVPDINRWLDFSPCGGEGFDRFYERVGLATKEILKRWPDPYEDSTVMFVTHGGTSRPILQAILDVDCDFLFFSMGNCAHACIAYREFHGSTRKAISHILQIDQVAEIMGEKLPGD